MFLLPALLALAFQNPIKDLVRVEYVLLDVVAVDRSGKPVTDLRAEDFIIKEGRQKINFDLVDKRDYTLQGDLVDTSVTKVAGEKVPSGTPQQEPYQMIIVLDLESLTQTQKKQASRQLLEFLDDIKTENPFKIYIYDLNDGQITDGFTSDFADARFKLETHAINIKERGPDENWFQTNPSLVNLEENIISCKRSFGQDAQKRYKGHLKHLTHCIQEQLDGFVDQEEDELRRIIGQLESVSKRFEDNDQPKFIYFVSPGFSLTPGRAAGHLARTHLPSEEGSTLVYGTSYEKDFRRLFHYCIKNRIVFNTYNIFNSERVVDRKLDSQFRNYSRGILDSYRTYSVSQNKGLSTLAKESGGEHFSGMNLMSDMMRTYKKSQHVYVLGYPSPKGKKGKYRKIQVKCKRSGVKLLHRGGYYGL